MRRQGGSDNEDEVLSLGAKLAPSSKAVAGICRPPQGHTVAPTCPFASDNSQQILVDTADAIVDRAESLLQTGSTFAGGRL